MTDQHEANRRKWDLAADRWRELRDGDGIWQRLGEEPELAFEGGVPGRGLERRRLDAAAYRADPTSTE